MRLDLDVRSAYRGMASRSRGHTADQRIRPSVFRYDYLALKTLADDIRQLIASCPARAGNARALDLGASRSPYRPWVEAAGYHLETFDSDPGSGADHVGDAAATGLPSKSFDLIVCTQVLEHVPDPEAVLAEISRLLRDGGWVVASVPHVWFYHPHPGDYRRYTQEGVLDLCTKAGFDVTRLHAQGGSALTLFQIANFLIFGAVGRVGAPVFAMLNGLGMLADRLVRNTLFSHNFAWTARRAGNGAREQPGL